jgi:hypothetical protein
MVLIEKCDRFYYIVICTKMANSGNQYQENLDILQTMIDKYVDSHTIIICGDMNGSLSIERNNNHDAKLKSFMKLNELFFRLIHILC